MSCAPTIDTDYLTDKDVEDIINYPHILGHMVGKTKLSLLHSYWIKYIWDTEKESKSLQAHRGSYKTTAVIEIGAIRNLLLHPDDRIAIIRKTFTDAEQVVGAIAQLMDNTNVQELFKHVHGSYFSFKTRRGGKITFSFKKTITPEGSVTAHGLDLGLTGKHYDRILCDDFTTLRDRLSKAERDKAKEVIREIKTNIIDPDQPVGYIGTPWHVDDCWTIVPSPIKFDVWSTEILTDRQIEEKKKGTLPSLWAANYELKHISDEDLLFGNITYGRWKFNTEGTIAHIDAAYDGDHTNGLTFFCKRRDGKINGIGFSNSGNVKNWIDFIVEKYNRYRAEGILTETNADKGFLADELRKRGLRVIEYTEKQNKHVKISTHLYNYWEKIEWDIDSDEEYLIQIREYRKGQEPDDAPDSAASLCRYMFVGDDSGYDDLYEW